MCLIRLSFSHLSLLFSPSIQSLSLILCIIILILVGILPLSLCLCLCLCLSLPLSFSCYFFSLLLSLSTIFCIFSIPLSFPSSLFYHSFGILTYSMSNLSTPPPHTHTPSDCLSVSLSLFLSLYLSLPFSLSI